MKLRLKIFTLLILMINLNAQDDIHSRVIFLGNAGEINPAQTAVIENAASQILSEKTRVVYLGNNIYPDGFPVDERESSEKKAVKILESQFLPMRQKGAEVIFIPGYREWDNNGPNGLGKIMAFNGYIEDLEDENIKVLPPNGQPGVESIELSENLAIAILDSEWWLYPFEKGSRSAQRGDKPEGALEAELREFLFRNRNKTIILALHHPFISYGKHAGEITWKDHLFPLTNAEKNLYIPLPVVGSLYPLTKTLFPDSQDLRHPLYKDMVKRITKLFDGFPNLIIVSSHDDGLQLLEDKERGITQIITGIGGNIPYTKSGKKSLFNASLPGYVVMDLLQDGEVKFTFYGLENNQISNLYEYKKPHEKYEDWKDDVFEPIKGDSIKISPSVPYDKLSKVGRFLMGENFRKTWGTEVTLPVLRLSEIDGGLKPIKLGGGNQSTTARLVNPDGKTYALRSVEKRAEGITPEEFQGTFVTQVLDDGTSSLHPYGALVVPPIAEAAGVPHSHPIIGVIAPDSVLGSYQKLFVGKINLLEEREPLPPTDNYRKALKKLRKNNKNTFDAINFLNARMLDLLIADWDRHEDQWRFHYKEGLDHRQYTVVPRDRDMVFDLTQGPVQFAFKRWFLKPRVHGFNAKFLPAVIHYMWGSSFLNAHPENQINYEDWMAEAHQFRNKITDEVLEDALDRMPKEVDENEKEYMLSLLKSRRDQIPEGMDIYYKFVNKIVDIQASDKNELVEIQNTPDGKGVHISMRRISSKGNIKDTLMSKIYTLDLTKEIRLYLGKGNDSLVVNNNLPIKLKVVGGDGNKSYNIIKSKNKIKIYDRSLKNYYGKVSKIRKRIRDDKENVDFVPVELYEDYAPTVSGNYDAEDGISLGLGIEYFQQKGFRKTPYTALHNLMLMHSFETSAFRITYEGDWTKAIGQANLLLGLDFRAPANTQNFFGIGNETRFDKSIRKYERYYRSKFDVYTIYSGLKWKGEKWSSLKVLLPLEVYYMSTGKNKDRFIYEEAQREDSGLEDVTTTKFYGGVSATYAYDRRNDDLLPTLGYRAKVELEGKLGLNSHSQHFLKISPEFSFYKNLNSKHTLIIGDRVGGAIAVGNPAFYQLPYLGGQGNLLGFPKYRFAGKYSMYNNLEMRLVLSNFGNYLIRGQIGVSGFYDTGRVWVKGEKSNMWHHGYGAGLYFSPAGLTVMRVDVGHSVDGWFPYLSVDFRF